MSKTIEISVNYVDRGVEPPTSTTVGAIVFDQEDLSSPPKVLNPLDFKTVALLKRYVDSVWAEHKALSQMIGGE